MKTQTIEGLCSYAFRFDGDRFPEGIAARAEIRRRLEALEGLIQAAQPFVEWAEYIEAHPRTGISNEMYGFDGKLHFRMSDCKAIRDAVIAARKVG